MDSEFEHTITLLDAQHEYMDINEEDAEFDEDSMEPKAENQATAPTQATAATQATEATKPQRKHRKTSSVWKDFILVGRRGWKRKG
ncbi:hypothetical protein YC2023_118497 [Brassica napus]